MDLNKLTEELVRNTSSIFEAIESEDVDWGFPDVTIITTKGQTGDPGSGGTTEDSSETEVIDDDGEDQEGQEGEEGSEGGESGDEGGDGGESSGGGDGEGSSGSEVKPGSIVQDMTSGEYGKVTKVNSDGSVEWEPVGEDELKEKGFLATPKSKAKNIAKKVTKFDRSDLRGFVG